MSLAPQPSFATLPRDDSAATVLEHLVTRFPRISPEIWRERMEAGKVLDERGLALTPASAYRPGARIAYFREVPAEPEVSGREEILYRDDHLLAADKPPFLPVIPSGPFVRECLLYRLRRSTGLSQLAPLHRLDRMTSGVVLFSLEPATRAIYHGLFARGEVEREYQALANVDEVPAQREWRRASRIVRGEPWFRMHEVEGPPNAVTRILLEDLRGKVGSFRLFPESGKKHQLRLHLAALGFPILGDRSYPQLLAEAPDDVSEPLRLVARRLAFRDPRTGTRVELISQQHLLL